MKTVLQNAIVLTADAENRVWDGADVLIDEGRIAGVCHHESRVSGAADRILNCAGKIVIPGLVSAHSHLTGLLQRGLWDETSFESWSRKSRKTEAGLHLVPDEVVTIHTAACVEFVRHGVTTILNMFTPIAARPLESAIAACDAFCGVGVRGILALSLQDRTAGDMRTSFDDLPTSWIDLARDVYRHVRKKDGAVGFMLAPSAPQRCTDDLLIRVRELAEELGIGFHTHLAETRRHAEQAGELYGERMVFHLQKIGFLGPRLSVAHCIWVDDAELDILQSESVKTVHNPASNLKLGSGVAKIKKMLRRGLCVGLGADSVNAGTVYSVFEQMKLAVLVSRITMEADDWLTPAEAFLMATRQGSRALLLDGVTGSIEVGKQADLVILAPSAALLPINNLVDQLALCENGMSVESVLVGGKPILLNGRFTAIDEKAVFARLAELKPRVDQASAGV